MKTVMAAIAAGVLATVASGSALADGVRTSVGGPTPVSLHCRIDSFCIIVLPPGERITGKHLVDPVDFELDDDTIGSGPKLSAVLVVKLKSANADGGETDALVTTDGPGGIFHVHIIRDEHAPATAALRFTNEPSRSIKPEDGYAAIRRLRLEQQRLVRDATVAEAERQATDDAAAAAASRMPCLKTTDNAYRAADVQDKSALFVPTRVWNDGKHTCIVIPPGAYDLPIVMVGGPGNSEETVNFRFDAANRMFIVDGTPPRVILIDGSGKGGRRVVVAHK